MQEKILRVAAPAVLGCVTAISWKKRKVVGMELRGALWVEETAGTEMFPLTSQDRYENARGMPMYQNSLVASFGFPFTG